MQFGLMSALRTGNPLYDLIVCSLVPTIMVRCPERNCQRNSPYLCSSQFMMASVTGHIRPWTDEIQRKIKSYFYQEYIRRITYEKTADNWG